jgi:hypothetical protein
MSKITVMHVVIVTSMTGFQSGKNLTVSSNCTVVLQADTSDKPETVLDRLTVWISASAIT